MPHCLSTVLRLPAYGGGPVERHGVHIDRPPARRVPGRVRFGGRCRLAPLGWPEDRRHCGAGPHAVRCGVLVALPPLVALVRTILILISWRSLRQPRLDNGRQCLRCKALAGTTIVATRERSDLQANLSQYLTTRGQRARRSPVRSWAS